MSATPFVYFTGDGVTRLFPFTFTYIRPEFIEVLVNGVPAAFSFFNDQTVSLSEIPADGDSILIRRNTDASQSVVFSDGSILLSEDLNIAIAHTHHIAEEGRSLSGEVV